MPYAFNDDKSKYSLSTILNQITNLTSRINGLMVSGTNEIDVSHGGTGTDDIYTAQQTFGVRVVSTEQFMPGHDNDYKQVVTCPSGYNSDNSFIIGVKAFPNINSNDTPVTARFVQSDSTDSPRTDSISLRWDENVVLPTSGVAMQALIMRVDEYTTESYIENEVSGDI